jgi:hypothetical protein
MRAVLILTMILWAVAFFGSFVAFYLLPPQALGFADGAGKVMAFAVSQIVSAALALLCLMLRWGSADAQLKRWALVPSLGVGLVLVGFAGLYIAASAQSTG